MATYYTLRDIINIIENDDNEDLLDLKLAFKFNGHYHTLEYIDQNDVVDINGERCILVETPYYPPFN